jgi:spermidine/putrescine transport system substrate-binding protein
MLSRRSRSAALPWRGRFASPLYVKNAFSSSGELNLLMWSDEFPDPVIPNFEKATGIKVNQTPFSQNEEQINKLQATGGEGFDMCQPTATARPSTRIWRAGAVRQNKLKNMNLIPSMLEGSRASGPGRRPYHCRMSGAARRSPGAPTRRHRIQEPASAPGEEVQG